jgi:hypothetical protein
VTEPPSDAARLLCKLSELGVIARLDLLDLALREAERRGAEQERRRILRAIVAPDPDPSAQHPPVIVRSPNLQ